MILICTAQTLGVNQEYGCFLFLQKIYSPFSEMVNIFYFLILDDFAILFLSPGKLVNLEFRRAAIAKFRFCCVLNRRL